MIKIISTLSVCSLMLFGSLGVAGEEWVSDDATWPKKPLVVKSDEPLPADDTGRGYIPEKHGVIQQRVPSRTGSSSAANGRGASGDASVLADVPETSGEDVVGTVSVEDIAKEVIGVHAKSAINARKRSDDLERVKVEAAIAKSIKECKEAGGCKDAEYANYGAMDFQSLFDNKITAPPADSVKNVGKEDYALLPKLIRVTGNEAMFETSIGTIRASVGSRLPGGYTVKQVTLKGAVVDKEDMSFNIALSWKPVSSDVDNAVAIGTTMPPALPGFQ